MKNIIDILGEYNIKIPEENLAAFNKVFAENYKTIVEHSKALDKVAAEKKRADTAEEALKGFEGIDPKDVQKQLADAQKAIKDAQDEAARKIAERDSEDALRAETSNVKFTSEAAKRDFMAYMKEKGFKAEGGKVIGFNDRIDQYKADNPDAIAVEGATRAHFTQPSGGNNTGGKALTKKDIRAEKDPVVRQRLMAENSHLYVKG